MTSFNLIPNASALLVAISVSATVLGSHAHAKSQQLKVCSGYGCILSDQLSFTKSQARTLKSIMAQGKKSAKAERAATARAIARMEVYARHRLGYAPDVGKAFQKHAGKRGQMDCVDESLNTTAYLSYLHQKGWLRHHKPRKSYAERGFIFDGRYPHKSAVMIDSSGNSWAVDSWPGNDGEKPQIMSLTKWRKMRTTDG